MTNQTLKERIEKEFEKIKPVADMEIRDGEWLIGQEETRTFILSLISQILQEKAEEIGKMKQCDKEECYKPHDHNVERIKDEALDEAIRIVKEI